MLLRAPKNGVAGGRINDAVIGACAEQGKASTGLTFNVGDFTALGQDFDVVVPGPKYSLGLALACPLLAARLNSPFRLAVINIFPTRVNT